MTIETFFPIKVFRSYYNEIESLRSSLIPKLLTLWEDASMVSNEITECVIGRTDCGFVIDSHLEKWEETRHLIDFLNSEVQGYWKELGYSKTLEPYVWSMWSNRSHERSYIHSHIHSPMAIAGAVYLDVDEGMGNFVIEDPNEMLIRSQPVDNPDIIGEAELDVKSGDVLMFPGYVRHRTITNSTNKPRITLPFVVGCKGNFMSDHWRSA